MGGRPGAGPAPGIGTGLLRVGGVLFLGLVLVAVGAGWWQVVQAGQLTSDPRDPLRLWVARNVERGRILDARGVAVAADTVRADGTRVRRYRSLPMAPITGYRSLLLGTAGLERTYDELLAGIDGLAAGGGMLRKLRAEPWQPVDLTLSVDARFQAMAARLLGDRRGAVVAIEPATGRILVLASTPGYDPNRLADPTTARAYLAELSTDDGSPLLGRATQGRYVPGSVLKVVTAIAALESGRVRRGTTFPEQPAESRRGMRVDGARFRDSPRTVQLDEPLDLAEAMEVSSNVWFARAVLEAGAETFLAVGRRLGFGSAIAFDLPTSSSQLDGGGSRAGFADRVELASAGFGQGEVLVTPLQMAMVAAAVANDGVLMAPRLVDRLSDAAGRVVTPGSRSMGRVMSSGSASAVASAMERAVEGTYAGPYAGGAKVPGVRTAGKSGTAELAPGEVPHSWFVGFAPAEAPRIAIAVVVEHGGAGSSAAVPIGGRLMRAYLERFDPAR
ncbi:MAG: penicillin-binding protein 2 [Chloroflexi bacterium]|nr:penicillin-binding protein 2 [Chloroflexota bacterium]